MVFFSGSSMFQPLCEKSKAPEPPLPGPGQYEPNRAFNIVTHAKNVAPVYSSFKSNSTRGGLTSENPGPCFYSPRTQHYRRNFRVKTEAKIWV